MKRFLILAAFCLFLLTGANAHASAPRQTRSAKFEPVSCATFRISGSAFECGYVRVPELHSEPNGRQIKLAVAILPSPNSAPDASVSPDAFVVAQGGPGGSTLDTFANFFQLDYFPALKALNAERDIVLYDQRGTLYAQPNLTCPEELSLTFETIDRDLPAEELLQQQEAAALACRDRLLQEGVHLAAYNSFENALDIEDLRRALGYAQFDFYGISYGTLLALHAMHATPATFRSVILDAVVPPQINPNATVPLTMNRAFEQLFASCAQDADCQRAFPNLKQVFYETVDALNTQPARVNITDRETGKTYNAVLDGDTYLDLLFQFLYNSELIPALPKMIYDAREGRFDLVRVYWPLVAFDRTFASGMYYSVMCAEDADFTVNDLALAGVDEHIAAPEKRDTAAFLQLCQKWNVPPLGEPADAPVQATIPTLVFSGNLDPITPPPFGQIAAETITPSYTYVFPAYGHGALTSGNCPNQMIVDFVRDPTRAPNAQCIREVSRVAFVTPTTYVFSSGVGEIQYAMLQGKIEPLIVPLLLMFVLLTVFLVGPLFWLIRRAQHRPSEASRFARVAPWLAALTGVFGAAFFVALFVLVLVIALSNENTIGLVLGTPRNLAFVFVLPLLAALSALGLLVAVVRAWRRASWAIVPRLYYTLLALTACGLTVWLAANGMLTILV